MVMYKNLGQNYRKHYLLNRLEMDRVRKVRSFKRGSCVLFKLHTNGRYVEIIILVYGRYKEPKFRDITRINETFEI